MIRGVASSRAIVRSLACAIVLWTGTATAEPATDAAGADELFDRAKALLLAGRWDEACPKFQASMDLDPSVATLIKLARCHEHDGRLALALHDYNAALALNLQKADESEERRAALGALAREGLTRLEARMPRLRVVVTLPVPGLRVTRGGRELPLPALGEALPMDPGPVEVVASAPGYKDDRRVAELREGTTTELRVAPVAVAADDPRGVERSGSSGPGTGTVLGAIAAGAGVVALGVSAGLGIETLAKVHDSSGYCNGQDQCSQAGVDLRSQARADQTAGFVSLGAGVALVTAGLVLLVVARRSSPALPAVSFVRTPGPYVARPALQATW
jgi:hypothetical protein